MAGAPDELNNVDPDNGGLTQDALDALMAQVGEQQGGEEIDWSAETVGEEEAVDAGMAGGAAAGYAPPAASAAGAIDLPSFDAGGPAVGGDDDEAGGGFSRVRDIPLDVTVELGRTRLLIRDILDLNTGSIIELDKIAGEPVDLFANGLLVARGEVVVIDDNFGVRVTEIITPAERNKVNQRDAIAA